MPDDQAPSAGKKGARTTKLRRTARKAGRTNRIRTIGRKLAQVQTQLSAIQKLLDNLEKAARAAL